MAEFGELELVPLREAWPHEAHDFTNWLAEDKNLGRLSDELGLEITKQITEYSVGAFSVDILAEEAGTEHKIVIENQLEMTNHDHLGKLITYASGLGARHIIWIFKDIRDEHKIAIDWLNQITHNEFKFYAVKIELLRMGGLIAPKFKVLSPATGWSKSVKQSVSSKPVTSKHSPVWASLLDFPDLGETLCRRMKVVTKNWQNFRTCNVCHFGVWVRPKSVCVYGWVIDKEFFRVVHEQRDSIEATLGFELLFDLKTSRRIYCEKQFVDINDKAEMTVLYEWLKLATDKFYTVLKYKIDEFKTTVSERAV